MLATQVSTKKVISSATVLVLEPYSVQVPTNAVQKFSVAGRNRSLDASTSPAVTGLPQGVVVLATVYAAPVPVTVLDQFTHPLDPIFAGTAVTEDGDDIHLSIDASGSYLDPVGPGISPSNNQNPAAHKPPQDSYHEYDATTKVMSPVVAGWISVPSKYDLAPIYNTYGQSNTNVEVGTHRLEPQLGGTTSISKRGVYLGSYTGDPQYNILINWPDPKQ